ncbi:MAG: hypothetical protein ACPG8N_01515, partial [Rhodothermales bacterium]
DMSDPDLVARIAVTSESDAAVDGDLLQAIVRRNTIRRGFLGVPLPSGFTDRFLGNATDIPEFLCVVRGKEAESLILGQLQETERTYQSDKRYRRETDSWMHPMRKRSRDGIPMNPDEPSVMNLCWSSDDMPDQATMLTVLTETEDTPRAWLETGEHLMQVLLEASGYRVNAAIMNLPATSTEVREMITSHVGCSGDPILLVRFGRPSRKLVTSRRPLVDVMLHPGFRH